MIETPVKRILIIRFSSLGDVVLTTALLPNLRAHWPDAEIDILSKWAYAPVFDGNPHVNQIRIFDPTKQSYQELIKEIRNYRYDVIIDLQGNFRSWMIRLVSGPPLAVVVDKATAARQWLLITKRSVKKLDRSLRQRILDCLIPLEVPMISEETQLFPRGSDFVLKTFDLDAGKKLIALAPGAQHRTKQWSPESYALAANRLGAIPGSLIVILGDKNDQEIAQQILPHLKVPYKNLTGWTSIPELVAVLSKCSFLLTNDSGILHMGEALKIPLVALFGPTVKGFGFFPYRSSSRVVEIVNLSCRPCSLHGEDQCPLKHHKCMQDIDPEAVMFAASEAIGPL